MSVARITFGIVDPDRGREAYQWQRGFAGANQNVYGRPWSDYEKYAVNGQAVCATDENDDFVGLCYFHFDKRKKSWEIGGMMVAVQQRGRGIGSILGRIAVGHVLFEEDPYSRGENVVVRVLESNTEPRPLLLDQAFRHEAAASKVAASELEGVVANPDGTITLDHFHMEKEAALAVLIDWGEQWRGRLRDGTPAEIRMRPGITIDIWVRAFKDMLTRK